MTLRAGNLTIAVPYYGCDKNCPYCVSKMTGNFKNNRNKFLRNFRKVKTTANAADVFSVLITGKGEPLITLEKDESIIALTLLYFNGFNLEIQTNGLLLSENVVNFLDEYKVDTIALSIDSFEELLDFENIIGYIKSRDMSVRVTVNLSSLSFPCENLTINLLNKCKEFDVDHFKMNPVSIPEGLEDTPQGKFISSMDMEPINDNMKELENICLDNGPPFGALNYGPYLYDVDGISVSSPSLCIQESHKISDLRSLIYLQDGHLYTSWKTKASKIF